MESTVSVIRLSKSYASLCAVESLNLHIHRGEVFGLLGANGAGKSTAIECILGTKRADQGSVTILGMEPEKDRKKLFERVGVQFQEASYQDKITVTELCEITESLYRAPLDFRALIKQFGLSEKLKSPVATISGGEKQRLFVLLALIPDPEVVFLDEPATGLDAKARRELWKCLTDLKEKGLTILLTSHFMDEVEALCDRICILKHGRSIFMGTVEEAISKSPYEKFEDAYLWYTEEEKENENV